MAFDCHEKKPLLFADLFKPHKINRVRFHEKVNNVIMPVLEGSSSSSSNPSSFCDSSSSGFTSPFGSELGSSEGENGDFIAELTRQMAECMLQEDDEDKEEQITHLNDIYSEPETSSPVEKEQLYTDCAAIQNPKIGFYSSPFTVEDRTPPIQVYQVTDQPPVNKQGSVSKCRRFNKGTESTQPKQFHKTEHHYVQQCRGGRDRANGFYGSGMQAVFLRGSPASRNGSSGTGVFLPCVTTNPTRTKKKSGCSTVLIPTRVLQALELHFSRFSDSSAPPSSGGSRQDETTSSRAQRKGQLEIQSQRDYEMQLPQEWTY